MARQTREGRRISDELLDELVAGDDPAEVFRSGCLIDDLKKAVAERALDAEMDAHPEHEPASGNHRNGHNRKQVLTDEGAMELAVPRDRAGRFEPRWVEKYCRRLPGFDDKALSMYARGMTTEEALDSFEAGPLGGEVPRDRAQRLGAGGGVLRVLAADPPGGLHDQRDREPELHDAPGGAHPRALPQRPRGDEAALPGAARGGAKMTCAAALLAPGASGARDPLRRTVRGGAIVTGRRDFHRLPTGAWATHGPAPVDRPWKSLRAPARQRSSAGAGELGAVRTELLQ